MSRKLFTFCLVLVMAGISYAGVIGNWEGMPTTGDGWINWSGGAAIETLPAQYSAYTGWHPLGSQSLQMTKNGWAQTLSLKLEYQAGEVADFLANSKLEFDWAVPADTLLNGTGGYQKIENVVLNASGWGWNALPSTTYELDYWNGSPFQTKHIVIDYSAAKALVTATPSSGYIELIFTTNNDSVRNVCYFDNVQLTPEPATMALLGLGGLALIRRKR